MLLPLAPSIITLPPARDHVSLTVTTGTVPLVSPSPRLLRRRPRPVQSLLRQTMIMMIMTTMATERSVLLITTTGTARRVFLPLLILRLLLPQRLLQLVRPPVLLLPRLQPPLPLGPAVVPTCSGPLVWRQLRPFSVLF